MIKVLRLYIPYLIGVTAVVVIFDDVVFNTWFIGFAYGSISGLALAIAIAPSRGEER